MKVVVISGSPRKTANTQIIMKYVFEYTKSKNEDTKLINLSDFFLIIFPRIFSPILYIY